MLYASAELLGYQGLEDLNRIRHGSERTTSLLLLAPALSGFIKDLCSFVVKNSLISPLITSRDQPRTCLFKALVMTCAKPLVAKIKQV